MEKRLSTAMVKTELATVIPNLPDLKSYYTSPDEEKPAVLVELIMANKTFASCINYLSDFNSDIPLVGTGFESDLIYGYLIGKYLEARSDKT